VDVERKHLYLQKSNTLSLKKLTNFGTTYLTKINLDNFWYTESAYSF